MKSNRKYQSGLSMVEILVAALIGLLGTVIVMQVMTQSESGRRTTGNVASSQTNGQLAIFLMERDLMQAGQGIIIDNAVFNYATSSTPSLLNCTVRSNLPFNNLPLIPLAIIPAGVAAGSANNLWNIPQGDANSDMIAVAYGSPSALAEGMNMAPNTMPTPPTYSLPTVGGINTVPAEIDYAVVSESGKNCTLGRITAVDMVNNQVTLDYNSGVTYSWGAMLFNLGPSNIAGKAPRLVIYAVRNGVLTACDFFANGGTDCTSAGSVNDPTVWTPIMENVVALQAQYGWETTATPDGVIDTFCKTRLTAGAVCPAADMGSPAPASSGTAAQRACDWTRITSLRFAVVTRGDQYEKTEVSPASLRLWPDSATVPTTTGPLYTVPDRHYRYRVFQSSVALRSAIALGSGGGTIRVTSQCYN